MYLESILPPKFPNWNHMPSWSKIMSFTRLQLDGRFGPLWWLGAISFPLRISYRTMAFTLLIDSLWVSRVRSRESRISFYSSNGPKRVTSNFGSSLILTLGILLVGVPLFYMIKCIRHKSFMVGTPERLCVRQSWVLSLWFNGYCFASFYSWL